MKTQYVTNEKGEKVAVILPMKAYQKLMDEAEELEDIKLYDEVTTLNEPTIPLEDYLSKRRKNQ